VEPTRYRARLTTDVRPEKMHYSWSIGIVITVTLGWLLSIVFYSLRKPYRWSLYVQASAILFVALVLFHNMYWERHINTDLSRGWTLLYTLPTAIIGELALLIVAVVSFIFYRKMKNA